MQTNNKNNQKVSKIKSFYFSCRSHLHLPCSNFSSTSIKSVITPISNIPYKPIQGDHKNNESLECHLRRVRELERQLEGLEGWFGAELGRLKSQLRSESKTNNEPKPHCFEINKVDCDDHGKDSRFGRLDGGMGYLYYFNAKNLLHGYSQDLVIQFSSPSLVPLEIGSNVSQVLNQMAAMGKQNLITWLLESMPIKKSIKTEIKPFKTPIGLLEAILLNSLKKFENLVIKGLHIQNGDKEVVVEQTRKIGRKFSRIVEQKTTDSAVDEAPVIMVILIQARDPLKGYAAMNEMMIGFVEVEDDIEDQETGFVIKGVHIAGLVARKRNGQAIHNCLWHASA